MEDIRTHTIEEDEEWYLPDDERNYDASTADENGVPFSIPRD